ncbi:MAG: ATP-binding protein [candidate division Zixibacteria bacterium]|nr:ATP-binding protein [candidate division Zixibacteria bacterium]
MKKIIRKDNLIIIPSSQIYLAKVDNFVEKRLKKLGLNKDQLADIAISVTEVVNNAIVHGNKNDPAKKVTLRLETDESSITIEVEDEGKGFDLNTLPCPITEENLFKEVGRGIFILRSLMDKVDFVFKKEGGTVVRLVKYLKKDKKT